MRISTVGENEEEAVLSGEQQDEGLGSRMWWGTGQGGVGGAKTGGGGREGTMWDSNLPRWLCQMSRHPLAVVGAESFAERIAGGSVSSVPGSGSVLAASRMDHSVVVLPK